MASDKTQQAPAVPLEDLHRFVELVALTDGTIWPHIQRRARRILHALGKEGT